ncbi:hypothetical protein [Nocardiopsis tropica]|uniref:Uncharacterized protein n=1 Tax=Nocardiopsis tropica TaxID=109330 RepID=A0ABV1ZXT3_9ACTN
MTLAFVTANRPRSAGCRFPRHLHEHRDDRFRAFARIARTLICYRRFDKGDEL